MPFKWTLNPYRGCTHGCHYCFTRRYQDQLEMGAGDDFSSVILVKVNFPKVLRRELMRGTAVHDLVALGTATDSCQPAEGALHVARPIDTRCARGTIWDRERAQARGRDGESTRPSDTRSTQQQTLRLQG